MKSTHLTMAADWLFCLFLVAIFTVCFNQFYILMQKKCICRAFMMYIVWIGLTALLPVHQQLFNYK